MKSFVLLSAVAASSAFILPNEQVFQELTVETRQRAASIWEKLPTKAEVVETIADKFDHTVEDAADAYDSLWQTVNTKAEDAASTAKHYIDETYETAFDMHSWVHSEDGAAQKPPPYHKPEDSKPNKTVYELIAGSKYTSKLAELINKYDDIVKLLNGTSHNFTVFAPTNKAFEKIPKHAPKPSKEFLKQLLSYHVSKDFYPAGKVLFADTIPTVLEEKDLGGDQRIAVRLGGKGLTLNFYAGVVAPNIFGTNGVIHGIESILVPPPPYAKILNLLPSEFSTLLLGLAKTGLAEDLAKAPHVGGTLFAPNNFAFKKLGPGANAFLFSEHGLKYLKAIIQYHAVANITLYSDALYTPDGSKDLTAPHRNVHLDLPTLLEDYNLPVDIARFGPYINIRVNGYSRVSTKNGVAKDGVIQLVDDVLIPPKKVGGKQEVLVSRPQLTVEELKERLEPFVDKNNDASAYKWNL